MIKMVAGVMLTAVGLLLGVPLLVAGLGLTIFTLLPLVSDATGLGIIVGPRVAGVGLILCSCLWLGWWLLRPNRVGKIILTMAVAMSVTGSSVLAVLRAGQAIKKDRREIKQLSAEEAARDTAILAQFSTMERVRVQVICRIRRNVQHETVEAIHAQRRQEARELIIDPLGPERIRNVSIHAWGAHDVYFLADVTRDGYEQLKHNEHVWKIALAGVPVR
jgi:hypothetical protein